MFPPSFISNQLHWISSLDQFLEGSDVTVWRHSRLRAHWLIVSVCGWSLTAGKILFTGRQTCSLCLVLCLCGYNALEYFFCVYIICFHVDVTIWSVQIPWKHAYFFNCFRGIYCLISLRSSFKIVEYLCDFIYLTLGIFQAFTFLLQNNAPKYPFLNSAHTFIQVLY